MPPCRSRQRLRCSKEAHAALQSAVEVSQWWRGSRRERIAQASAPRPLIMGCCPACRGGPGLAAGALHESPGGRPDLHLLGRPDLPSARRRCRKDERDVDGGRHGQIGVRAGRAPVDIPQTCSIEAGPIAAPVVARCRRGGQVHLYARLPLTFPGSWPRAAGRQHLLVGLFWP